MPQRLEAPRFGNDRYRVSLGLELERTNQLSLNVDAHEVWSLGITGCDRSHVVNQSAIANVIKRKVAAKPLATFKQWVRQLTRRSGGRSMGEVVKRLRLYLLGWKAYFWLAQTPRIWLSLDEWSTASTPGDPAQALDTWHDDVPGAACARRIAGCGAKGRGELPLLVEFGRKALAKAERAETKTKTFDFLRFTHQCARSRTGKFTVHVKSMKKRLKRAFTALAEWCRAHRHDPVAQQQQTLNAKLRGHYQYYWSSDELSESMAVLSGRPASLAQVA